MKARGNPIDREAPLLMKLTDPEDDGVWGKLDEPFVGFKVASVAYRSRTNSSPEKFEKEPE